MTDKLNDREHQILFDAIKELKETMVPKVAFTPVRNVVYGLVGVILLFTVNVLLDGIVETAHAFPQAVAYIQSM
jgi:hypothetical protein